jgi:hypothetical protein
VEKAPRERLGDVQRIHLARGGWLERMAGKNIQDEDFSLSLELLVVSRLNDGHREEGALSVEEQVKTGATTALL